MDSESMKPLLEDILSCLAIIFMLCFIQALATTNVHAIYGCSVCLILASAIGCAYTYETLAANHSSWPIVFKIINLVAFASIIAQEVWFMHKAYKQIFSAEKLKFEELLLNGEELLLQKQAQRKEQEEILGKMKDNRNRREKILGEWEDNLNKREDNLSKWEEVLTKQEENLKREEERVAKAERPDLEGLESQQTAEEMS
ncbi:hypothetical protein KCU92_g2012, partial [Aureobasidium melanogenum]|jgi:hypothetical protein